MTLSKNYSILVTERVKKVKIIVDCLPEEKSECFFLIITVNMDGYVDSTEVKNPTRENVGCIQKHQNVILKIVLI